MTFKQYLEQTGPKAWIAKKKDVLRLWSSLREDMPLNPQPVSSNHVGNRFDQDGVRITGSSQFVNSVLAKLKPLLFYSEHPSLELDVKYRQVVSDETSNKPSFACYINVVQKGE